MFWHGFILCRYVAVIGRWDYLRQARRRPAQPLCIGSKVRLEGSPRATVSGHRTPHPPGTDSRHLFWPPATGFLSTFAHRLSDPAWSKTFTRWFEFALST
jgi:hypothetical protein